MFARLLEKAGYYIKASSHLKKKEKMKKTYMQPASVCVVAVLATLMAGSDKGNKPQATWGNDDNTNTGGSSTKDIEETGGSNIIQEAKHNAWNEWEE